MKRKNIFALWIAMAMLSAALYPAVSLAEKNAANTSLRGLVTEVLENGLLIGDPEMGEVLLNVDPETVLEGVLAEKPLEEGMYVIAKYNGNLTRTSPPQTHADRLACYPLAGTVAEILPEGVLLIGDPIFDEVIVRVSDAMPRVHEGVPMTVYYDGAMAMSLPGKVTARHIVVPVVKGTVKTLGEDRLVLDMGGGELLTVHLTASSLVPASWFDGSVKGHAVTVYYDGEKENGELTALEVVDPASIVEENEPLTAEELHEPEDGEGSAPTPSQSEAPDGTPAPSPSNAPEETQAPPLEEEPLSTQEGETEEATPAPSGEGGA